MMRTLDALRSHVTVTDAGCWTWQRGKTTAGYGVCYLPNRVVGVYTHRLAYELAVGAIPVGLTIDHLCRNRACCNPDHLEPVTQAENVRRSPNCYPDAERGQDGMRTRAPLHAREHHARSGR